jgi:FMN-dependent NADH-azoreductase
VVGITFAYTEEGVPVGLCRAKRLYYVTTAGGTIFSGEFGYGYIRTLTQGMYGIPETFCFQAEGLDVAGADVDAILSEVEGKMDAHLKG